jgi:ABC-type amino acid transport system permease subunit
VKYNWDWGIFWQPAPDGTGIYLWWLVSGLGWTLATALLAWVIALALGATVGTLRTTPLTWVVRLATPTSSCSATSRCWCRCFCGISSCRSWCRRCWVIP